MDNAKKAPWWMWIGVALIASNLVGAAAIFHSWLYAGQSFPLCADARDRKIAATAAIRVRPDCWSGWVKLTPGTKFDLLSSGEAELLYWGGGRRTLPNKSVGFLGPTPSTFSIRGKGGTVTVRLHDE